MVFVSLFAWDPPEKDVKLNPPEKHPHFPTTLHPKFFLVAPESIYQVFLYV